MTTVPADRSPARVHPLAWFCLAALCGTIPATPVSADDATKTADATARAERFAALTKHVPEYVFTTNGTEKPFDVLPKPVLRWTNPVRDVNDGGVFVWTDRGRAAAILCAFWRNDEEYKHEFQSLAEGPFDARLGERTVWAPEGGGVTGTPIPKPTVAASRELRLVQMRQIARAYRAQIGGDGGRTNEELRLLRQPLYRYAEEIEAPGVVDGALFAFVQTTDPEVLVLVEARGDDREMPQWHIAFARMSRWRLSVRQEEEAVWSCEWAPGTSPKEPYFVLTYTGEGRVDGGTPRGSMESRPAEPEEARDDR